MDRGWDGRKRGALWLPVVAALHLWGHPIGVASAQEALAVDRGIRVIAEADGVAMATFAHPAYQRAEALVRIADGRVVAGTDADALTLGTYDAGALWNNEMAVLLMDVNSDGFLDIGVLDGVGYGGVNVFWSFWRANAERLFMPVGIIANPERDPSTGTIRAASRSGPFWTTEVYRPVSGGLRLVVSREHRGEYDRVTFPVSGKGRSIVGIIPTVAPDPTSPDDLALPAFEQVAVAVESRAFFFEAPDAAARRSAYLVEGDVARVLDVDATGQWYLVTFTHGATGVTTDGWLRAEDMALVQG